MAFSLLKMRRSTLWIGVCFVVSTVSKTAVAQQCTALTSAPDTGGFSTIVIDVQNDCTALTGVWPVPNQISWRITEVSTLTAGGAGASKSSNTGNSTDVGITKISMTPPGVVEAYSTGNELHFNFGKNWSAASANGNITAGVEILVGPGQLEKVIVGGHNTTVRVNVANSTQPSIVDTGTGSNISVISTGLVQLSGFGNWSSIYFDANIVSIAISGDYTNNYIKAERVLGQLSGSYNLLLVQGPSISIQGTGDNAQLQLNGASCGAFQDTGTASSCSKVPYPVAVPTLACAVPAQTTSLNCASGTTSAASVGKMKRIKTAVVGLTVTVTTWVGMALI